MFMLLNSCQPLKLMQFYTDILMLSVQVEVAVVNLVNHETRRDG